jgi:hypothetical protein
MSQPYLLIPQAEYTSLLSDLTTLQCRITALASRVARFDLPLPQPHLSNPYFQEANANVQVNVGNDVQFQAHNHGEGRYQGERHMHHGYRDMHSPDNRRYQDYTIPSDFPPDRRCEYASGWRKENQMFHTVHGPEKPGMFSGRKWKDSRHCRDDGMRGPGGMGGTGGTGGMCGMGGVGGMGGKGGMCVGDMYISSPTMPQFSGGGANHNGERVGGMEYSE